MNEENNNNVAEMLQTPQVEEIQTAYASFGARFLALIIDILIVGFAVGLLSTILMMAGDAVESIVSVLSSVAFWAYFIYMDVNYGATLGKKVLGMRVKNVNTGENLTYVEAFLREVVGRFVSGIVLFVGYLWMLWDPKKQTWHDKIGSSVIIKENG